MKKLLSLMLVLAMLLSMVPAVFAEETGVVITSGTNVAATVDAPVSYTWTASANGTLTVTMGAASPGWKYTIFDDMGNTVGLPKTGSTKKSADFTLVGGTQYTFTATGFNSSSWDEVAANLTYTLTFVAEQGSSEIEKKVYEISETALALGDNNLMLLETAVTTIYAFEPAEVGVYTFTAPAGAIVGYWGAGTWFLSDPGSTVNTCEWTCTGVGQSAYIGVSGVTGEFALNVEKTGDYQIVVIPTVLYENKADLSPFTVPTDAKLGHYVDVYSETTHTAVYSEADGYYHLDSVDGDVLLVDMNYMDIILSAALKSDRPVMYAYTTDENGDQVKYDIGNAILEYEAVMDGNGYYPLTEDLLLFYEVYAMGAGTFTYHLTGTNYNEECVWMYCMRTMKMDDVVIEPSEPTDPSEPVDPSEPEQSEPTDPSEPEQSESTAPSEPEVTVPSAPIDGESVLNETVTADKDSKYVFSYKPESDGVLSITVGDGSTNWSSDVIYFVGLSTTTVGTASGTDAGTYSVDVTAGTTYRIRVWQSGNAKLTQTPVSVVFLSADAVQPTEPEVTEPSVPSEPEETDPTTPSEPQPSEPVIDPDEVAIASGADQSASVMTPITVSYKPSSDGVLTIVISGTPGYKISVVDSKDGTVGLPKTSSTGAQQTLTYKLTAGETYTVRMVGYVDYEEGTANITYTVSFKSDEQQGGGEVEKEPYEVSNTELKVGDNGLTMLDTAVTTIFKFKPTETGTYTFTAPEGAAAGYWGSNAAYLTDPANTSNTCQWTCTGVGQSAFIGVSGIEGNFVLTIVKEVEETEPTVPSEPEETDPTEPSETEPSEPETEPTTPSVPDESVPENAVYSITSNGATTYYTSATASSMSAAIAKVSSGAVKLYQNVALGSKQSLDFVAGTFVLDLNGCTISNDWSDVGCVYVENAVLTICDTSAQQNGLITNANSKGLGIENYGGTVVLESGRVTAVNQGVKVYNGADYTQNGGFVSGQNYGVNVIGASSATINGGIIEQSPAGSFKYAIYAASAAEMSITGGYFNGTVSGSGLNGKISGGYFIKTVSSNYIASGCELQANEDATYLYKVVDPNAVEPEEPKTPVAQVGQTQYYSVADAIAAANGSFVKLLADVAEDITVSNDLYLDLNGYTISGCVTVAEGATLYGMDSTTDDYDCADGYGKLTGTVTGNVAAQFKSDITGAIKRYVAITEQTGVSFHRIYMGITRMSLKPGTVALGYRAVFAGDDVVKAALAETGAFGIRVWVDGLEDNAIILSLDQADFVSGKTVTARVQGIDVEAYGDADICAETFLTIGEETITGSTVSGSMKYMLETVNNAIDSYTAAQKDALAALVEKYYAVMHSWNVGNIYTAPDVDVPVEDSDPVE